jgi:hypothetical protein
MDTTRDILYRGYYLNNSTIADAALPDGLGQGLSGCVVDDFDPDDLDVVQFSEKRAEADGLDVGNPFLGGRRIRMQGTIYGQTRGLAYDEMLNLRATMNPILAQREIPDDHGYLPLYFAIPTNDTANFPSGARDMRALVMPKAFHCPVSRDEHGGVDSDQLAFNWSAVFAMRDPQFEGQTAQDVTFADTTTSPTTYTGSFTNRGTYVSPLNMLFRVGSEAGSIAISAGGSIATITIPASTDIAATGATATASTDLVNKTSHGLAAGDQMYFTTLTGGAGLALSTKYYVISTGLTADAFSVSATYGGAAVDITSDYSTVAYKKVADRVIRIKRDKTITVEEAGVEALKRSWLTFTQSTTWPLIPAGSSTYTVTVTTVPLIGGDVSHAWFWEMYA